MELFEKQQTIEAVGAVIKARVFFVGLLLVQVFSLKIFVGNSSVTSGPIAFILVGASMLFSLFCWFFIKRSPEKIGSRGLVVVKALQIVVDEIMVSIMVYTNGTVNTLSVVFYLIAIMSGSILYKKKGVLFSALAASFLFTSLALMEFADLFYFRPNLEIINSLNNSLTGDLTKTIRQVVIFNVYCVATAIYAGYLASLNKKREKRLESQRDELVEKTQVLTRRTKELTETKNWLNEELAKSEKIRLQLDESRLDQEIEKNKVAAVLQNLTDGLLMVDREEKIILINNEAERLLKTEKSKVISYGLEDTGIEVLKHISHLRKFSEGLIKKQEFLLQKSPELIVEINTAQVFDISDKKLGELIILHDVSREKIIERMKSEFVTIAAHQLRTPLSAIKWALNLVLARDLGKLNKGQEETLRKGYQSNERMIALINDLLNVARIEEGRFTNNLSEVDFSALVEEAISNFKEFVKRKGIEMETKLEKGLLIKVDKEKILLALQNLIENAVNYSFPNSVIFITVKKEKNDLIFWIKDQGIGIPRNQQMRLFSKFFRGDNAVRAETEGSGLGLFITKNIIESHGGEVWFDATEGKGTIFSFSLPLGNQ